MNKQLLMLSAVALLVVASCKKTLNDKDKSKEETCSLKEMITTYDGSDDLKTVYKYDDQGRVTQMQYADDNYAENYTYSATQIKEVINDGSDVITTTFQLDATGKIVSASTKYPASMSYYDSTSEYIYNAEGYLGELKRTTTGVNGTTTSSKYTYANGNLTSIKSASSTTIITYTNEEIPSNFYLDLPNGYPLFATHALKKYFGKVSKNMILKVTWQSGFESYSYEKDAKGQVNKVTSTYDDGTEEVSAITYNCN